MRPLTGRLRPRWPSCSRPYTPGAMAPLTLALAGIGLLGVCLVALGAAWMRAIGADARSGRRLAGARELAVADALDLSTPPPRPVRLTGRVRCADPIVLPDGEQLVAYHRDVEVQVAGRWRTIERLRETRSFDLWDHAGSLVVDPARAAEPLITIPQVWEGDPGELEGPHAAAVARLVAQGSPPSRARATTRALATVDRLLVLADLAVTGPGGVHLEPPPGGYLISALELDAAMRLLGGRRRRQLAVAGATQLAGAVLAVGGLAAAAIAGIAHR